MIDHDPSQRAKLREQIFADPDLETEAGLGPSQQAPEGRGTPLTDSAFLGSHLWSGFIHQFCQRLERRLEHDAIAYCGSLGHPIPGWHDGRLRDGTTPENGLAAALVTQLAAAQAEIERLRKPLLCQCPMVPSHADALTEIAALKGRLEQSEKDAGKWFLLLSDVVLTAGAEDPFKYVNCLLRAFAAIKADAALAAEPPAQEGKDEKN